MPTYSAVASDGVRYDIEGPPGATQEEILAAIEDGISFESDIERKRAEYLAYLRDREEIQPEPEDESLFLTNIGRGIDQLQQAYGSALEGVGDVTGLEGLEQYGADVLEENRRQLEETAAAARSTKDIEGLGSFATEYVPATFGAQVPQLGSTLAGSAAGAAIGSVVPIIGTGVGAIAGGIAANLPYFFGANREAQKEEIEKGNRLEVSNSAAALTAIPQSVLDFIADRFLISGFTGKALTGGGIFTRAATGVGKGIVAEVPTEIGQQVLERVQAGQELTSDEALDEYFEVAVAAGLIGGTVRGTGEVLGGRRRPLDTEPTTEEQLALPPAEERLALPPPDIFDERGAIRAQDDSALPILPAPDAPLALPAPEGIAGLLPPPAVPTDPETGAILTGDETGVVVPEAPDRGAALRSEIEKNNEEIVKLKRNTMAGFETGAAFDVMARIKELERRNALLNRDAGNIEAAIPVDDPRFAAAEEQKRQQDAEAIRQLEESTTPIAAGDLRQIVEGQETPDTALGQAFQEAVVTPEVTPEVAPTEPLAASAEVQDVTPDVIPTQASLSGLGRPYAQTLRDRRRGTDERPIEPRIFNEETLNELGIPTTAAIRKRIIGKDFNDSEVRQDLATFAGRPRTPKKAKSNINRLLSATPDEQTDIFGVKDDRKPAPRDAVRDAVSVAAGVDDRTGRARVQDTVEGTPASVPGDTQGTETLDPAPVVGLEPDTRTLDVGEGGAQAELTQETEAFSDEDSIQQLDTIDAEIKGRAASAKIRKKPGPKRRAASAKTEEKPTTTGRTPRQKRVAQEAAAREVQGVTTTEFPPSVQKSENDVAEARDAVGAP